MSSNKNLYITLAILSGIGIYVYYKNKNSNAVNAVKPKTSNFKNANNEMENVLHKTVKYGDNSIYVGKLKRIINYFTNSNLPVNNKYDKELLKLVQNTMKDNPALFDFKTGKVCVNMIVNLEYLIKKANELNLPEIDYDEKIETCPIIKKGDRGNNVKMLQRLINIIHNENVLSETGKYSKDMHKIVDELFDGTNVLKQDGNGGICLMFVESANGFLNNLISKK